MVLVCCSKTVRLCVFDCLKKLKWVIFYSGTNLLAETSYFITPIYSIMKSFGTLCSWSFVQIFHIISKYFWIFQLVQTMWEHLPLIFYSQILSTSLNLYKCVTHTHLYPRVLLNFLIICCWKSMHLSTPRLSWL